ncbi:MAG: response regulator transcription factor [Burkholderiales bacterium]|nr:response regulator transcription factor [Burkholderiales bacterium]
MSVYLRREGYNTITAFSGRQALEMAARHNVILTVLDILLPDLDGWEVCRRLRSSSAVPILIVSALGQAHQRLKGFTLGADDYLAKPFSFGELVARIKAILRRTAAEPVVARKAFSCGALVLDFEKRQVTLNGRRIKLTRSEYRLLEALMGSPGRVFLRDELMNRLYPDGGVVVDRVIDVHIGNLRHKVEAEPCHPQYILTARGLGYAFTDETAKAAQPTLG